jgi:hypothetical protein
MLAALVSLVWWRSYQQVRETLKFERALVAAYAAEGGVVRATGAAEAGAASGTWTGRLGVGVYEARLAGEGGRLKIVARGYWAPGRALPSPAQLARLNRFGGYKTRLTVSGRVKAGRFVVETMQRIP